MINRYFQKSGTEQGEHTRYQENMRRVDKNHAQHRNDLRKKLIRKLTQEKAEYIQQALRNVLYDADSPAEV
jgi:hypothetical protein